MLRDGGWCIQNTGNRRPVIIFPPVYVHCRNVREVCAVVAILISGGIIVQNHVTWIPQGLQVMLQNCL